MQRRSKSKVVGGNYKRRRKRQVKGEGEEEAMGGYDRRGETDE